MSLTKPHRPLWSRPVWSERNARRDQVLVIALGIGFVLAMAIAVIVFSHTWGAGSIPAASR